MTDLHPITPPPELVDKLFMLDTSEEGRLIAAYRAGADQELEACCAWLSFYSAASNARDLRAARRPESPRLRLKGQALEALGPEPLPETGPTGDTILNVGTIERHRIVRRALEALDDYLLH